MIDRNIADELIALIDEEKVNIARSYEGGLYYETGRYMAHTFRKAGTDIDRLLVYRAITSASMEINVAGALGLFKAEPLPLEISDTTYIVTVNDTVLSEMSEGLAQYIASIPLVYDTGDHPELIMKGDTSWGSTLASYSGNTPPNIAYFSCRDRALAAANQFWCSSSVVWKEYPRKSLQKLKSLKKSEHLINALLLGHAKMHITQRRGKIENGMEHLLLRIDYLSENLPEEVKTSMDALRMFEDVASLWQYALKDADVALALNQSDLDDADVIARKIRALSEFTSMSDFMDTYLAGVPAADIMA